MTDAEHAEIGEPDLPNQPSDPGEDLTIVHSNLLMKYSLSRFRSLSLHPLGS